MNRNFPGNPWCRYADDGLVHCKTELEAQTIKKALQVRFGECHLEMHPTKTKIVYCKDEDRKGGYLETKFDFLGYTFRPRSVKNKYTNRIFLNFTPAVSSRAAREMRQKTREMNFRNRTELELTDVAKIINPILRGWMEYFGKFCPSAMYPVLRHFNRTLVRGQCGNIDASKVTKSGHVFSWNRW